MKIYSECQACKKKRLFIRKRTYTHKIAGKITSQSELCRKCYKDISTMLK